jgi:hypothetical protein
MPLLAADTVVAMLLLTPVPAVPMSAEPRDATVEAEGAEKGEKRPPPDRRGKHARAAAKILRLPVASVAAGSKNGGIAAAWWQEKRSGRAVRMEF